MVKTIIVQLVEKTLSKENIRTLRETIQIIKRPRQTIPRRLPDTPSGAKLFFPVRTFCNPRDFAIRRTIAKTLDGTSRTIDNDAGHAVGDF